MLSGCLILPATEWQSPGETIAFTSHIRVSPRESSSWKMTIRPARKCSALPAYNLLYKQPRRSALEGGETEETQNANSNPFRFQAATQKGRY